MKHKLFTLFVLLALLLAGLPAQPAKAAPATIYVDADSHCVAFCGGSWATAYPSLSTAIAAASSGDMIWVAEGVYYPGAAGDRTATFTLKDGVRIYGGFDGTETDIRDRDFYTNLTILSGDIDKNDDNTDGNFYAETNKDIVGNNSYHVVIGGGTNNTAILDGFILTAGQSNGSSLQDKSGGGIKNSAGRPTLSNLNISGNYAESFGGGIYGDSSSNPTLTNIVFNGNYSQFGGGMSNEFSNPSLTTVTFSGNEATSDGGGMYNSDSAPLLDDVTFTGNEAASHGGGMFNNNSDPSLTTVTFSGNEAAVSGGGMYNTDSAPLLDDVIFTGNDADNTGGGMYNNNSDPSLTNVTLSGNTAFQGGGMYNSNSQPALLYVTINENIATYTFIGSGGMYNSADSHPILHGVLIANSTNGDCGNAAGGYLDAASSHNLIEDSANACGLANGVDGNIVGLDPLLGPLADNGGSTQTHALLTASPAIDTGNDASCPAADQRGAARPNGLYCDIGAYESNEPHPYVVSIVRASPDPTAAASVDFTITFSEPVDNVHESDFQVTVTSGTITGAAVTFITGNNTVGTITVSTGTGDGTFRLDVLAGVGIHDADGNLLLGLPYTSGEVYTVDKTLTVRSVGANDGWILETGENTTKGGTKDSAAATLRLGDDATKKQYRSILSFATGDSLPDNAVITKVTLKVKKQGITGGGNPVTTFRGFMADIKKGLFGTSALQATDFQAGGVHTYGPFTTALAGGWYTIDLTTGKAYINKLTTGGGLTQIRLRFSLDDNNNAAANYLSLHSGDAAAAKRPQLIIEYYVP